MTLILKSTSTKPDLKVVVHNPGFTPAVFHSRLGLKRAFLKKHRVISNGPYLNREERESLKLANWVEGQYHEYVSRHFGDTEALVHVPKTPEANVLKGAIKLLRERNFAVTYTEIHNRTGGRFTVSRRRAK